MVVESAFRALYPVLRARIRDVYDCTPEGAERAREALQQAMDGIDRQLGSREYFFDDRLTRADITFASLGAFFVLPEEYPVAWPAALREHPLMTWFAGFRDRPGYRHIVRTYQRHRPRDTNGLST